MSKSCDSNFNYNLPQQNTTNMQKTKRLPPSSPLTNRETAKAIAFNFYFFLFPDRSYSVAIKYAMLLTSTVSVIIIGSAIDVR